MILDGKKLRDEILDELKEKIKKEKINATLAIVLAGDDEASKIYIKNKKDACEKIGIHWEIHELDENFQDDELIDLIHMLSDDERITGIILQSPLYSHLDFDKCASEITSSKDVDGFTQENIYNLYLNKEGLVPCTVKGIIRLIDAYKIPLEGKSVLIIGRGNIVGHPLSLALTNRNATVTLAHSHTKDLENLSKTADIVISAVGKPKFITASMIKDGAVVIDVGISRVDGKIVGDVDFDYVKEKAAFITPNPGGVGPMTVAMIMENVIEAYERRKENGSTN